MKNALTLQDLHIEAADLQTAIESLKVRIKLSKGSYMATALKVALVERKQELADVKQAIKSAN